MKKRLTRDQENRVIAGVLSGLANYFNHDPVLYRIVAVFFLIVTGFFPGILLYLAGWLLMPKGTAESEPTYTESEIKD